MPGYASLPFASLLSSVDSPPIALQSYLADFQRFTKDHARLQCFDLGFALNTFRMVRVCCGARGILAGRVDASEGQYGPGGGLGGP